MDIRKPARAFLVSTVLMTPLTALAQSVETRTVVLSGPVNSELPATLLRTVDPKIETLDRAFLDGRISDARLRAERILCKTTSSAWVCAGDRIDPAKTRGRHFIVWAGKDVTGAWVLRRMLLQPVGDRAFALDLQGAGTAGSGVPVYEVFLANDKRATLVSAYKSTRVENPLLAQIPAVAMQVITPLFAIAGSVKAPPAEQALQMFKVNPTTIWVTTSRVALPYERATIAISSQAQLATDREDLAADVSALTAQVKFQAAAKSSLGQAYADKLAAATTKSAVDCADTSTWQACLTIFNAAFKAADDSCQRDCLPSPLAAGSSLTAADEAVKKAVEDKFRTFVEALPKIVNTDASLANTPLTHYSFTTMVAFNAANWSATRARVKLDDSGKLAADPLPRPFTMVGLNWSPRGYDAASFRPLPAEVSQLFIGAVILPDVGVAGGWSYQLMRGLAFNVGVGVIASKGLNEGDQIGQAPSDSTKPFALAFTPVAFVGASVNFTGK